MISTDFLFVNELDDERGSFRVYIDREFLRLYAVRDCGKVLRLNRDKFETLSDDDVLQIKAAISPS